MASFGHVALGMLTGRLHGGDKSGGGGGAGRGGPQPGGGRGRSGFCSWKTMALFAGLALLPDADVILVALGTCDAGACGHRGASHSLPLALAVGILAGIAAWRVGWPVLRTTLATTIAVASHALLDVLGAGGRGLPLLWPFSEERFMSPIRIFPDAPRGSALLSRVGLLSLAIEFAVFLPVMLYAVWPRIAAWMSARARAHAIPQLPELVFETLEGLQGARAELTQAEPELAHATFIEGSGALSAPPAPSLSADHDPPIRSAG
ncbi:MAG TPA: metal-dependent hydrolase [Polyangia bacterium]|jgi:inner membrane protein